jgi:UDP-N-acetylglucosamine diphosphorylase / glucose-1-phosphate thymidylyltransferase / UDP-N-acetylgalactosamine diphosphorylase / glucosamine-1-phosphate N-acetyltransferase / galactosamine-1-phosphate N-acetyltransferase
VPEATQIGYFFEGDPALPFPVAEFDEGIEALASDRAGRLAEWIGSGEVVIEGVVDSGVAIDGPAYIGSGTTIHSGCTISGPVFIGKNCSIRHGAQLRDGTILGDDCVVGHSAEIKNSICMSGSKMQSGVFIGDSVLGRSARVGSGAILANRRFDQRSISLGSGRSKTVTDREFFGAVLGDHVRLGANVVAAPGTLVGPYTWVSSLVSLHGFIPRAKLVLLKQELEIRDKDEVALRSGRDDYETI